MNWSVVGVVVLVLFCSSLWAAPVAAPAEKKAVEPARGKVGAPERAAPAAEKAGPGVTAPKHMSEKFVLFKLYDRGKDMVYQVMSESELKALEKEIRDESFIYQNAMIAAEKEWKASGATKGKPFPRGAVAQKRLLRMSTYSDRASAEAKRSAYEEQIAKKEKDKDDDPLWKQQLRNDPRVAGNRGWSGSGTGWNRTGNNNNNWGQQQYDKDQKEREERQAEREKEREAVEQQARDIFEAKLAEMKAKRAQNLAEAAQAKAVEKEKSTAKPPAEPKADGQPKPEAKGVPGRAAHAVGGANVGA